VPFSVLTSPLKLTNRCFFCKIVQGVDIMEQRNRNFLGIMILVFGIIFLLQKLDILPVAIFFTGWWTLLLIIPALFSMSKQGVTVGNAVLLILGIFFFFNERGWNLSGFLMPAILIAIGIGLLLKRN